MKNGSNALIFNRLLHKMSTNKLTTGCNKSVFTEYLINQEMDKRREQKLL